MDVPGAVDVFGVPVPPVVAPKMFEAGVLEPELELAAAPNIGFCPVEAPPNRLEVPDAEAPPNMLDCGAPMVAVEDPKRPLVVEAVLVAGVAPNTDGAPGFA